MDKLGQVLREQVLAHHDPIGLIAPNAGLALLNERSRDIFRQIVESYLATGEPVGSRNISRLIAVPLSPASVRNVMSDLEQLGLIYAPHTSAGRLPTELGLRFFVDALMQVGDLTEAELQSIQSQLSSVGRAQSVEASLAEARLELETALTQSRTELDQLTQKVIAAGIASWSGGESEDRQLIVRGHANLLEDLHALEDLERVKSLFDDLETKRGVIDLLGRAEHAEGVRIFIGSENKLFSLSGSSTIIAPYSDGAGHIVGVLGVIGRTRLNYARVIPLV